MLTNDEMTANRFGKIARGRKILRSMSAAWDAGKTVYVSTMTNVTKIAPKHRDAVVMGKSGSLYVRNGKRASCIDFCKITIA